MISVVVPVYNMEKYVVRCVKSIIEQTFEDIEIILVDDGSTDRSGDLCDELKETDIRIKVIHKSNGGLSESRNVGIDVARGEYIAFVDSDDYIHPQMYEILYKNIKATHSNISMCDFWWIENTQQIFEPIVSNDFKIYEGMEILHLLRGDNTKIIVAWNKLYKTELFHNIRYPVGKLHEDEFVVHRLLFKCDRVVYTDSRMYYYIKRGDSITGRLSMKRIDDYLEALEDREHFFDTHGETNEAVHSARSWIVTIKNRYNQCEVEKISEQEEIKRHLKEKMSQRIDRLYCSGVITYFEKIKLQIWMFNPSMESLLTRMCNEFGSILYTFIDKGKYVLKTTVKCFAKVNEYIRFRKYLLSRSVVDYESLRCDNLFITIAFDNDDVIKQQIILINRYCETEYIFLVIDNSTTEEMREKMFRLCSLNYNQNVRYCAMPSDNPYSGNSPSKSHGMALTWCWYNIVRKIPDIRYLLFLDHDIFPLKSFSIKTILSGQDFYGIKEVEGDIWYIWPGYLAFDMKALKNKKLNFMPWKSGDTGSALYKSVYRYYNIDDIIFANDPLMKIIDEQDDSKSAQETSVQIIDESWLHMINASDWAGVGKMDIKFNKVMELLIKCK